MPLYLLQPRDLLYLSFPISRHLISPSSLTKYMPTLSQPTNYRSAGLPPSPLPPHMFCHLDLSLPCLHKLFGTDHMGPREPGTIRLLSYGIRRDFCSSVASAQIMCWQLLSPYRHPTKLWSRRANCPPLPDHQAYLNVNMVKSTHGIKFCVDVYFVQRNMKPPNHKRT